jgi:hypothetical protein
MSGTEKMQQMITELALPESLPEFMKKAGIADCESFALMASKEEDVKVEILDVAKAANVILDLKGVISVKKLWRTCRKILDTPQLSNNMMVQAKESEGLPEEVEIELKDKWKKLHNFLLPDSWLVNVQMQKKIWKDCISSPPKVDIILLEQLKLATSLTRTSCTILAVIPGRQPEAASSNAEMVAGPMEVFMRARAWFMTTCFCSVGTPDFLDMQVAIFGSDKILSLALKTDGGQHPPVQFLAAAWAQTIQYFAEQVRITGKPLAEFVQNTGAWEHRWTWSRPDNRNGGGGGGNRETDLPAEIVSEMKRLREESRVNQSLNDRLKTKLRSYGLSGIEGNGGKKQKHGKGGGKNGDKNKGKQKDAHGKGGRRSRSRGHRDRRDKR